MDLKNKLDINSLLNKKQKIKKIFFYRVCGTGMGAAAILLKEKGYEVEGGDNTFFPPMSDYLKSTRMPLYDLNELTEEKLKEYDLIVVGNVVPRLSQEARMIEELGVPFCSFPAALGAFVLHDMNVVGVAGTHGKTTTTYFLSQMFEKLGQNPGHLIGGVLPEGASSRLGDGRYFFIESDEYDSAYFEKISKFRSYTLNHMILTSLEFDHADIFDSIEDIKKEFEGVLPDLKGHIVANSDYQAIRELSDKYPNRMWHFYGENSEFGPRNVEMNDQGSSFNLYIENKWVNFETKVIGGHNILNLTSCISFALNEGFTIDEVRNAVADLKFVKRRQEVRGTFQGADVIDDFAHHPRSVACTIETIKNKYPNKKIVVVLEPNSATARSNIFQKEFSDSLTTADEVYIAKPARATTVKNAQDLDYSLISKNLTTEKIPNGVFDQLGDLQNCLNERINSDKVLLVLSNGTCLGLWKSDFVEKISE